MPRWCEQKTRPTFSCRQLPGIACSRSRILGQTAAAATIGGELRGDELVVVKGAVALKAAWQGVGKGGE